MNDLSYFVDEVLIPALQERYMDNVFSQFGIHFTKKGDKWGAKNYLDGSPHKWNTQKIWTSSKVPFMISEQGGDSINLIKFYQNLSGLNYIDAVKAISSVCNIVFPEAEDNEGYRAFRAKQEEFNEIADKMKKDLYSDEGKAVLDYLKSRGYSDEFIEYGRFGYCSPQRASELRDLLKKYEKDNPTFLSRAAGSTNILALPYRNGKGIQGFIFRRIDGEKKEKYTDVFISDKANKTYQLFGLTGLSLSGNKDKDRDLIVVEGEIDALRASFADVPNVVAASGGNLSPEAIEAAKRRGVLRITLLFDSEESEEAQANTDDRIEEAVRKIYAANLEPIVSSFEVWEVEGKRVKMDADSYLKCNSGESLKSQIRNTGLIGSLWMLNRLYTEHEKKRLEDGTFAEVDTSEFRRRTIQMLHSVTIRADRERAAYEYKTLTGGVISEWTVMEEAEEKLKEQRRLQCIAEVKQIAQQALQFCEQGKISEAIALGKQLTDLSEQNREAEFAMSAKSITLDEVKERYRNKPSGLNTGYYFGVDGGQEELIIQAAALTYICAPTSHGKTTFLQNLALKAAMDEEIMGEVLFITYEEPEEDIATEFLTLYCGEPLSANTLKSIRSLYENKGNYIKTESYDKFKQKEAEFDELLKSNKLRIYKRKNLLSDLSGFIKYMNKNYKIKAVFVDYVQRIKDPQTRGTKKDILESVCDELMDVSLSTKLPVVLGAQLNRQALSPLEIENQMIADASDIEHSANTIVLLWNSDTKPLSNSSKYYESAKRDRFTEEAQKLQSKGFNIGEPGKMFAFISKNRGGQRNLSAILNFNGVTRSITQYYPSDPKAVSHSSWSNPQPQTNLFPVDENEKEF